MRREILKFLHDVAGSITVLEGYGQRATAEALASDVLLFDGIKHRLAVIGEAFYQIKKLDRKFSLTNIDKIVGLRHIVVHEYDRVDPETTIAILRRHLPILKEEVLAVLAENPSNSTGSLDD